jgi:hypothetical protein
MTTSQASRVYGIPYNSLLMYVRGKYGKSLKLDVLKQQTTSSNDNLNTVGNSRSTPKEKQHLEKKNNGLLRNNNSQSYGPLALAQQQRTPEQPVLPALNPFAFAQNLPHLQEQMGLLGMIPPHDSSRIRELMQNIQREQLQMQQRNTTPEPTTPEPRQGQTEEEKVTTSSAAAVAQLAAAVQHHQQLQQQRLLLADQSNDDDEEVLSPGSEHVDESSDHPDDLSENGEHVSETVVPEPPTTDSGNAATSNSEEEDMEQDNSTATAFQVKAHNEISA